MSKGHYLVDEDGECGDSWDINANNDKFCSDYFYTVSSDEYFEYLSCPFYTEICGTTSPIIEAGKE